MYLKENAGSSKDTFIPVFRAGLLTIVISWKQFKRPLIDEMINKMLYSYNELLLILKKGENSDL